MLDVIPYGFYIKKKEIKNVGVFYPSSKLMIAVSFRNAVAAAKIEFAGGLRKAHARTGLPRKVMREVH